MKQHERDDAVKLPACPARSEGHPCGIGSDNRCPWCQRIGHYKSEAKGELHCGGKCLTQRMTTRLLPNLDNRDGYPGNLIRGWVLLARSLNNPDRYWVRVAFSDVYWKTYEMDTPQALPRQEAEWIYEQASAQLSRLPFAPDRDTLFRSGFGYG